MTDERVEKWKDWLEKGISNDVYSMHLQRDTWRRMHEIVDENVSLKEVTSYFWEWLFDIYAKTQAGAVRRQADVNAQVASLGQLIHEIKTTPTLLTRDWYLGHWVKDETYDENDLRYWRQVGEGVWADKFAGGVGDHIDPAITEADLAELRDGSEKVRTYVDKHVAHFDASVIGRGPPVPPERSGGSLPTLDEVHNAIDLVGRLFKKYSTLFTAADILTLVPVLQDDWEAVFRVQWLPDRELPEPVRLAMEAQAERDAKRGLGADDAIDSPK